MNAHITFSHEKVKFCVYLPLDICALPHQVFTRIFLIHLNTYSRGDVYTMRGNKIKINCIHNEIYTVTHKHTLINSILIICIHPIHDKYRNKQINTFDYLLTKVCSTCGLLTHAPCFLMFMLFFVSYI